MKIAPPIAVLSALLSSLAFTAPAAANGQNRDVQFRSVDFESRIIEIHNFGDCAVDLSALYLDVVKDRCYCESADDPGRRAAQTVMWRIVRALAGIAAPILSFLAEDIWAATPRLPDEPASIFLVDFPTPEAEWSASGPT